MKSWNLTLSRQLARRREEGHEQVAERLGAHAIKVVLALAPGLDQAGDPQERQVVAHGRLALAQAVAQVGDVQLLVLNEVEQDTQPRLVAQETGDLDEVPDCLVECAVRALADPARVPVSSRFAVLAAMIVRASLRSGESTLIMGSSRNHAE